MANMANTHDVTDPGATRSYAPPSTRTPRIPLHIIHRGVNRANIFLDIVNFFDRKRGQVHFRQARIAINPTSFPYYFRWHEPGKHPMLKAWRVFQDSIFPTFPSISCNGVTTGFLAFWTTMTGNAICNCCGKPPRLPSAVFMLMSS